MLAVLAALIGVFIVVAAVLATRPAPDLDPTTPEGVVQTYSRAMLSGDVAAGRALTTPALQSRCPTPPLAPPEPGTSLDLVGTSISGDRAVVRVQIIHRGGNSPFDLNEYRTEDAFELLRIDGAWRVNQAPWEIDPCLEARP